jgi:hypothetical protein
MLERRAPEAIFATKIHRARKAPPVESDRDFVSFEVLAVQPRA